MIRHQDDDGIDARCDAYLDGRLRDAARSAFDRRLRRDAELAAAVELQQQVVDSVRREYAVPDLDGLVATIATAARAGARAPRPDPSVGRRSWRGLWLALVTALLFGLAWACGDRLVEETTASEAMRPWQSDLGRAVAMGVVGAATLAGTARVLRRGGGRFAGDGTGLRSSEPALPHWNLRFAAV